MADDLDARRACLFKDGLAPFSRIPISMALNQGMPPIFTTTPMVGLSWASAPVARVAAKATLAISVPKVLLFMIFLPLRARRRAVPSMLHRLCKLSSKQRVLCRIIFCACLSFRDRSSAQSILRIEQPSA